MLTFKEKISYGIGRMGSSISINMTDVFTGFAYYSFFGLKEVPFFAFLAVALGKLVIAFSSYFSGYLSDRTNTRLGRRKPFIIIGAPLLALSFFMLYTPYFFIGGVTDENVIFSYMLLFNSLYQGFYGFLLTPFQSWLPEIALEKERLEVSGYQNAVNLIANVIGFGTSFLIPAIVGGEVKSLDDFQRMNEFLTFLTNGQMITLIIVIFALAVIVFFLPSLAVIKAKEFFIPQPSIKEELRVIIANKNYISWTIARGVISIALSGLLGIVIAWIQEVLMFETGEYVIFGSIMLFSIFFGYPLWIKLGNKFGKTKCYIVSMSYLAIVMLMMTVIGQLEFIPVPVLVQASIFAFLAAMGFSGYYLLPYAIVADIIEDDERRTGESRAGMYYGFESIPLNIFQFFGYLLVGTLLELPKITSYTGAEFSIGYLVFGPLASTCMFASVLIFWKWVNADPLRE
ncbi:MAG: MFS transporter [Candidatus Hodarchaeales archaeon]